MEANLEFCESDCWNVPTFKRVAETVTIDEEKAREAGFEVIEGSLLCSGLFRGLSTNSNTLYCTAWMRLSQIQLSGQPIPQIEPVRAADVLEGCERQDHSDLYWRHPKPE